MATGKNKEEVISRRSSRKKLLCKISKNYSLLINCCTILKSTMHKCFPKNFGKLFLNSFFIKHLCVNGVNGVYIRSISPYSVRMRENAGKMRTRITPNTDSFYAVTFCVPASKGSKKINRLVSNYLFLLQFVDIVHLLNLHISQSMPHGQSNKNNV